MRTRFGATLLLAASMLLGACAHVRRAATAPPVHVRLLTINDFHGQLEAGTTREGRKAAGAAVLASWLRAAKAERPGATLLLSAGDFVGNSPPLSAVLQDEPTIAVLSALAGDGCRPVPAASRADLAAVALDARCDVAAVPGNHELEEGLPELLRLTRGGDRAGAFETPWPGARFPFLAANVADARDRRRVFPAAVVREVGGVRLGVVGAALPETPEMVDPGELDGLVFLPIADAVNGAVRELVAAGVHAIVVVMHQGGSEEAYAGPTRDDAPPVTGPIATLVPLLDADVDVVVTGHWHQFTNARLRNAGGRPVLVTQAFSAGTHFARIDLDIDPRGGDVVAAVAEIVPAVADAGPGLAPDPEVARIVTSAREQAAPIFGRVITTAAAAITRGPMRLTGGDTGEWPLGDLVADAFRAAMKADVGLVQMGTLRADLPAGDVTWGDLFAALPFKDTVVRVTLRGRELAAVLEQQWMPEPRPMWRPEPYVLQVSGLEVTWDGSRPQGEHIVELRRRGVAVAPDAELTVALPAALADGTDRFPLLPASGRERVTGPLDVVAVEDYLKALPRPVVRPEGKRITRRAGSPDRS